MRPWMAWALAAAAALAAAWYPLLLHSPKTGTPFALDVAQLRALASSLPGEKPSEIRYEHVLDLTFAEAVLMAGDPWRATPMSIFAYQLVHPGHTVLIDAAVPRAKAQPAFLVGHYDEAAYARVTAALARAGQIVVTHEHPDHIGGILAHADVAALRPALRLTPEQLGNAFGMLPLRLPAALKDGYEPLRYDAVHALAPGVVLVKAPGHTPGSQMVYVQRADGRELLFLGDVSWRLRNIQQVRERPLLMTFLIREDRDAVIGQFQALHALRKAHPEIRLVPGHDGPEIEALAARGWLARGFVPPG